MGLSKYSHHTKLLCALGISCVGNTLDKMCINLCKCIFRVDSPTRDLCCHFIDYVYSTGIYNKNTLTGRIIDMCLSPTSLALSAERCIVQETNCLIPMKI